jgi:hypothetical protein
MPLPVAPAALLIALVPTFAMCGTAYWRYKRFGRLTAFQAAMFGVGAALAALIVAVSATYALSPFFSLQGSNWLIAAPIATYLVVVLVTRAMGKLETTSLAIWPAAGLAPLYFAGLYAWLLAACSFGDCL